MFCLICLTTKHELKVRLSRDEFVQRVVANSLLRPIYSDTTQLNSTSSGVELSCVAIDILTDATQLSLTIGNATDPVVAYSQSARSRSVELSWVRYRHFADATQLNSTSSWVELCRYKRALMRYSALYKSTSTLLYFTFDLKTLTCWHGDFKWF